MAEAGSKRQRKKQPGSEKWKKYKIEGEKITRERICPRCGPSVFLAKHKGRLFCGRCHYTSFDKKEIESAEK